MVPVVNARLSFELGEPSLCQDGTWEIHATMIVLNESGRGLPDEQVVFFDNGKEKAVVDTDKKGTARYKFGGLEDGDHRLYAETCGSKRLLNRELKNNKRQKAGKLIILRVGEDGLKRKLKFQAIADDGAPLKKAKILYKNPVSPEKSEVGETDEEGSLETEITLLRPGLCIFRAHIVGSDVSESIDLFG